MQESFHQFKLFFNTFMLNKVIKANIINNAGTILNDSLRIMTDMLDKKKARNTLAALMAAEVNPGKKVANVNISV